MLLYLDIFATTETSTPKTTPEDTRTVASSVRQKSNLFLAPEPYWYTPYHLTPEQEGDRLYYLRQESKRKRVLDDQEAGQSKRLRH